MGENIAGREIPLSLFLWKRYGGVVLHNGRWEVLTVKKLEYINWE
jgi:hypothetical protein